MRTKKCPKCGGEMTLNERNIFACPYCRFKDYENVDAPAKKQLEDAKKTIKDQEVANQKNQREINSLKVELDKKDSALKQDRIKKGWIISAIVIGSIVTTIFMFWMTVIEAEASEKRAIAEASLNKSYEDSGYIKLKIDESDWKKQNYKDVRELFLSKGFTNVQIARMDDLINGWLTKEGSVDSITINGKEISDGWHHKDSSILIHFHSFKDKTYESATFQTQFGNYL